MDVVSSNESSEVINHLRNCQAIIILALIVSPSHAQTLSESLLLESPDKLAQDARQNGNIVRGAILFHQGNINCIACHRPNTEASRLGPDLSQIDPQATDRYIVESILMPSKEIKKGYESVRVLTTNGDVFTGIQVSEDQQNVVLRSGDQIDRLITLSREDIEQIRPSSTSNMPDGLANAMTGRQQFLDLLRYVFDLRERGLSQSEPRLLEGRNISRQLDANLSGIALINKLNCTACHASATLDDALPTWGAPDLRWSAAHVDSDFLVEYLTDPHSTKPDTRMPHVLAQLDASDRKKVAQDIVHFLLSTVEAMDSLDDDSIENASSQQGFDLFHAVGCVACHSPRNAAGNETPLPDSVPLGDLKQKFDMASLVAFLKDPHTARPLGRMPSMQLTHREAIDLSAYLLSGRSAVKTTRWTPKPELVANGKHWFEKLECGKCHTTLRSTNGGASKTSEPALHLAIGSLDFSKGCLSDAEGNWPQFRLTAAEKEQIRLAATAGRNDLTSNQRIDLRLVSFNCTACHTRDGLGGVSQDRSPHFQTTNLNLGEQGRIPPTLSGVGAKLRPQWMRDVLVNGKAVRPYMNTRMPQYGEANVGDLIALFQDTDKLEPTEFVSFTDAKEMRRLGEEIAGNQGLNCVACHTFQYKLSDTMPAVDLTEMAERLEQDWFYQYMLDPQKFSPNTVMPSFWPGGKAMRPDIAGEPDYQIEALWQYLLDGRQARVPRGVIREPLEIVVTNEARMLRRKYPSMGKRGIGVGYPGGVNLSFDAEQMRLTQIWKGRFVDPSGVWYGQGHGSVQPLERPLEFPAGPEVDDLAEPWSVDEGRPPNHRFRGYELDSLRRPIFRYQYGKVGIEDYFEEFAEKETETVQLRRIVTFTSPVDRDALRFRVATGDGIAMQADGLYAVDQRLSVRIQSLSRPQVQTSQGEPTLIVPLSLNANQPQVLTIEYKW